MLDHDVGQARAAFEQRAPSVSSAPMPPAEAPMPTIGYRRVHCATVRLLPVYSFPASCSALVPSAPGGGVPELTAPLRSSFFMISTSCS